MRPDWAKFKVGDVSTQRNWTNPDCQPFETISHVAHHETARRIMWKELPGSGFQVDKIATSPK